MLENPNESPYSGRMRLISWNVNGIRAAERNGFLDWFRQANADVVAVMSRLPFAGFVEGTAGTEKGTPKATVWTQRAQFDERAKKMQDAVGKLQAASKSGNLDQVKAAFGDAAGTCKACHDDYRN